ncbi:MAG TPA: NAD-dependent epimerase/dehydratase family protein [Stellaceae bacterium]|nr:NAD-dependent epimerase/dehydratase family protein [Stellaceae bacterium]
MSSAFAPPAAGTIVVTGGAGFIGRALAARLARRGAALTVATRQATEVAPGVMSRAVGTIDAATDWAPLLAGAQAIVHLASRAHRPATGDRGWIEADAAAAEHLARAAARAGVARIVLLSSIKVLGERTRSAPFRADQAPAPEDDYGVAKQRIEEAMQRATAGGPMLSILRPPLVYGPGVKANFRALLRLVDCGIPLPFASIANRRSFVFVETLVDLVETVLAHADAGGTFLLRDDEPVSTPDLVRRLAAHLGRAPRLFPCPPAALRLAARALGRADAAGRLLDSLEIDDAPTRERLGWRPRVTLDDGLALTCAWYRQAGAEATR